MAWDGDQDSLKQFVRYLNNAHPTIKFTYECSPTTVDFLDLTLYKGPRFELENKLDTKPQLTRLLRACIQRQGYPRHLVTRAIDSVPFHKRESLLTQANKEP